MQMAGVAAAFAPGEAAVAPLAGTPERGYIREYAGQLFEWIKRSGSYGFPESHAASFAFIAYASA